MIKVTVEMPAEAVEKFKSDPESYLAALRSAGIEAVGIEFPDPPKPAWTRFMDMHSGGRSKEEWNKIIIEAPEHEAKLVFYNRFGHNPDRVTCTCCGSDYSIWEHDSLEQATAYDRNCEYSDEEHCYLEQPRKDGGGYMTLDEYLAKPGVLVIRKEDITPEQRQGSIPEQGYVWHD